MDVQLIPSENAASEIPVWGQYIKYFMRKYKLDKIH